MEQKTVLIIDDDPAIRTVLHDTLADEGYRVETAADGLEGLLALRRTLPDLVILDMMMPTLGGLKFASILDEAEEKVPILVITGGPEDVIEYMRALGASAYLRKPFEISELIQVVEHLTGSSEAGGDAHR